MPSARDVEAVHACFFEFRSKDPRFLVRVASLHEVVSCQTEEDGIRGPHCVSHFSDNLDAEAHPVFKGAAVPIVSKVRQRAKRTG